MTSWAVNDELFFRQLEIGHKAAGIVAARLRQVGAQAEVCPMVKRGPLEDSSRFRNECDLIVNGSAVDVKSSSKRFSGRDDFPFRTAMVDTVSGWNAKRHKPVAVILFSQPLGGMCVVPVSTQPFWERHVRFDRVRQIEEEFYEIPVKMLATVDQFIAWLGSRA